MLFKNAIPCSHPSITALANQRKHGSIAPHMMAVLALHAQVLSGVTILHQVILKYQLQRLMCNSPTAIRLFLTALVIYKMANAASVVLLLMDNRPFKTLMVTSAILLKRDLSAAELMYSVPRHPYARSAAMEAI